MINVQGLKYSYNSSSVISFPDFNVAKSSSCLLLGESGSGKTTLLHLLGGLLKSQVGKIEVADTDISKLSELQLDSFRAKHLGFIFQKNHLLSSLTVKQNLLLAPFLAHRSDAVKNLSTIVEELGLGEKINSKISELSQGQAQRVAIARALINEPSVILADEPTSALDDKNCGRVITLLTDIARRHHSTLVIATHDQRLKNIISNQIVIHPPETINKSR
jgi:putative ABC transport system ATP-binding protein